MIVRIVKSIWRKIPSKARGSFWNWFHLASVARPNRTGRGISPGETVVIAGMFRTASGLGAWARSTYHALKAAGYKVIAVDLSEDLTITDFDCGFPLEPFPSAVTGTLILHVNGPETAYSLRKLGLRRGMKWRVIGAWAWELQELPSAWSAAFPFISEIWALSDFAAEAFRKTPLALPVRVLPIAMGSPVNAVAKAEDASKRLFTVLLMVDALSSFERKNPMGAIEAFSLAFGERADCRLVAKVRNLHLMPQEAEALHNTLAKIPNVELISTSLGANQQWSLIANADVLLSLHRAEGFGLGLAEAMSIGVPVIATAWSGNLYYSDAATAALVPYTLVPVPDDCIHYGGVGSMWAEPDTEAAARWLQRLESDRGLGRQFAAKARKRIKEVCGTSRVQALATDFLKNTPSPKLERPPIKSRRV